MFYKAVPTPYLTNPVSLPSIYCMQDISLFLNSLQHFLISHTIYETDLQPSTAPYYKTFQVFLIYFQKCPSFSTITIYVPKLARYHYVPWIYIQFPDEKSPLLVECCFRPVNHEFNFIPPSAIVCYRATQIDEIGHIFWLFFIHHKLYWELLPWDCPYPIISYIYFKFRSIFQSINQPCPVAPLVTLLVARSNLYISQCELLSLMFKSPGPWRASLVQPNNIGLKQRPSLILLPVFTTLAFPWSNFSLTLRSIYNFLINLSSPQSILETLSWPCLWLHFGSPSTVFLPSFFVVCILPFPSFIYFVDHFLCNPWFFALPSTILIKLCCYCSTALPHSLFHLLLYNFILLEYLALSVSEHVTSQYSVWIRKTN